MSAKGLAIKYVRGQLRGDRDNMAEQGRGVNTVNTGHHGNFLAMHSKAPPPVSEYDAWLSAYVAEMDPRGRGKTPLTGAKLRRLVVMRRQGSSLTECALGVGLSCASPVKRWLGLLPEGLSA